MAVANGQQALDYIQTCQQDGSIPDVVLSDVMMPQVDGFQLVRQLRRNRHAWNVPIILLSGRVGEEARVSGLQAGADDFLNKPFSARVRNTTATKLKKKNSSCFIFAGAPCTHPDADQAEQDKAVPGGAREVADQGPDREQKPVPDPHHFQPRWRSPHRRKGTTASQ